MTGTQYIDGTVLQKGGKVYLRYHCERHPDQIETLICKDAAFYQRMQSFSTNDGLPDSAPLDRMDTSARPGAASPLNRRPSKSNANPTPGI